MQLLTQEWLHWRTHYYAPLFARAFERLGNEVAGARILEIGCGGHGQSALFGQMGARPVAADRYFKLVRNTLTRCEGGCQGCQAMAEALPFAEASFDMVFSRSVLVMVDRAPALRECRRVLKDGGALVAMENLAYHPLAYLDRVRKRRDFINNCLTPHDLDEMASLFTSIEFYPYWLVAPALAPVEGRRLFEPLFGASARLDRWLLRRFAGLGRFAWLALIIARK